MLLLFVIFLVHSNEKCYYMKTKLEKPRKKYIQKNKYKKQNVKMIFSQLLHVVEIVLWVTSLFFLRNGIRAIKENGILRVMQEVLTTMDLCGAIIELIFLWDLYGEVYFILGLFLCCVWWCITWGEAEGNPNNHIEEFLKRNITLTKAAFMIFVQVITAVYTYRFLQYMWPFGLGPEHRKIPLEDECETHILVSPYVAAFAEFLTTFAERIFYHLGNHLQLLRSVFIQAAVGTGLCVATLHLSGGYYNPVLATALQFGCAGHSHCEFFLVYWVSSIAGCLTAFYAYTKLMKNYLERLDREERRPPPRRRLYRRRSI